MSHHSNTYWSRSLLAGKLLWRDAKSGELNILIASLILAVATVTSISVFTSRIHQSIYEEASHFLAADAKVSGTVPISTSLLQAAEDRGIRTANIIQFRAMTFADSEMVLTQVKAVSESYPLKGELTLATDKATIQQVKRGPKPGEAWIAPRLFDALSIGISDTIAVGDAEFVVAAALQREPDGGQSLFGVAPRVMINIEDVDRTNAIQLGSRVDYALLLSADPTPLKTLKNAVEPDLGYHQRWTDIHQENRSVGSALQRAERFLLLTGCLSVLLSGVAIALAARRYAKRQQRHVAILKTFGTRPREIIALYTLTLLAIGFGSVLFGGALGWALHWVIVSALGDLMPENLAEPSALAYTTGAITGFIALWAFAAPAIFSLYKISPASILREQTNPVVSTRSSTAIGAVAMLVLMLIYSKDVQLTLVVAAGACACLLGVGLLSRLLIQAAKAISSRLGYTWRIGLANLKRHQRFNTLQIMMFSILFMLLFVLLTVRTSLIGQWQKQLPEDTPNHFVFNIFPDEAPEVKSLLLEQGVTPNPFYPMTRGRVIGVNGQEVEAVLEENTGDMNYERELNLTWSQTLGQDNQILSGDWWREKTETSNQEPLLVSAEEEYAKGLGLSVGDAVQFSVAGEEFSAIVANIRSVQWDSMNPNFFMIFNREFAGGSAANWITSFYLPAEQKDAVNTLSRRFPTVSLIELDQTIDQIQSIISKVSMAIEFILVLVLASGVLVLITSLQATLDIRIQESAIFRTLGANKKLVRQTLLIEFAALGLLAGLLAVTGMELSMFFLQTRVFELDYTSQFYLWFCGPTLSTLLIAMIGWTSTRKVVNTPPLAVLRNV